MPLLYSLSHAGIKFAKSASDRRSTLLSNSISLIILFLSMILFGLYYYWYGWSVITIAIPCIGLLGFSTLIFNYYGYATLGRIFICLFIPVLTTALSVYSKVLYYERQEELDYFTFRFIILSSCVFPPVFFAIRERALLIGTMIASFGILISFDPIHEAFDVPYRVQGLIESSYHFTNVVIGMTYCITVSTVLFLKWISEKNEERAESLIRELNQINEELVEKNIEIEAQNTEISAQSDNLSANKRRLEEAYKLIEQQKNLLFKQNKNLSTALVDKNKSLSETNSELIKHNNELRQFSYTVSHNLRGPVASLLGLIGLIDKSRFQGDDAEEIFNHIHTSATQLDNIIRDLGKIIDIRHEIFQIRQKINLPAEFNEIAHMLKRETESHHVQITTDFSACRDIYSVRPMVHSILYNLLSNAIKYRSPERQPRVEVTATEDEHFYKIMVRDNGIGIDLQKHRENLFKLYKRFHYHTEGKGLGLYLVKLQAETLGGSVHVESGVNKETVFTVQLAKPADVERQILFDEGFARIFFDANINSTGVMWNGPLTSDQYKMVFQKCLEFVKFYNTPNFIADLTHQGTIAHDDQVWMLTEIMPEAVHGGLKRIASVRPDANDPLVHEYLENIRATASRLQVKQQFFMTLAEATGWLLEENEKAMAKS